MSIYSSFSNVAKHVIDELEFRKDNNKYLSELNPWVRITSGAFAKEGQGAERGMIMYSNPDYKLFSAAGDDPSIYGNDRLAGTLGKDFNGDRVGITEGQGYRPSPVISSLEIDEGEGDLSRKASFSITAHTKQQMEEVVKYFLEPGYSLFVEWGWNTEKALQGFKETPDVREIGKYQSFKNTAIRQRETEGHYGNYLGYITGGNISIDGDNWTISVELTGFTSLPAYLTTNDKPLLITNGNPDVDDFGESEIDNTSNIGKKRFMTMFNELPQNRKTPNIKLLVNDPNITKAINFINFDTEVRAAVSDKSKSKTVNVKGNEYKLPEGTDIVKSDKFIKFSTLMEIINRGISVKGYELGENIFNFYIISEACPCYAFPNIYSTDEGKLFIPNESTPRFSVNEFSNQSKILNIVSSGSLVEDTVDNSVDYNGDKIIFPEFGNNQPIEEITFDDGEIYRKRGNRDGSRWGYLDNLYVNFDFAMDILGTKTMFIKDALYQILNGMSEAVNGIWDFQLREQEIDGTNVLSIVELNFSPEEESNPENESLVLNTIGTDSILLDSSFDLSLSGATINSVIGQRLSVSQNSDTKRLPTIFDSNLEDKILQAVEQQAASEKKVDSEPLTQSEQEEQKAQEREERRKEAIKIFTEKLKLVPKVNFSSKDSIANENPRDLYDLCYLCAYDNGTILSMLKGGNDNIDTTPAPPLPISFSFTVHGVSGIKRGDKFFVSGLPKKYEESFFQVMSVKHSIDGMEWTTEVLGKFRAP